LKLRQVQPEEIPAKLDDLLTEGSEPIAVMRNGTPVALLLPADGADLETLSLSFDPVFVAIIQKSREQFARGETISLEELERIYAKDTEADRASKRRRTRASTP
jgi:PHD/YefM family antitoxin component YafN of YafNO toxin-antitoxin module